MSKGSLLSISAGLLLAVGLGYGQTTAGPTFEVASVKPTALDQMKLAAQIQSTGQMPKIGAHVENGRAEYIFVALRDLIAEAYKLKPFQITGPDWLSTQRFDILAKMPEGSTKDQAPLMLQALLAERFKLVVHRETKERSVLALVVAKGGPKLQESPPDPADAVEDTSPLKPGEMSMDTPEGKVRMTVGKDGSSVVNMGKRGTWTSRMGPNQTLHMEGTKTTMSAFADMLSQFSQMTGGGATQVVDQTGLKGSYMVALDFSLADLMNMARMAGMAVPAEAGRGGSMEIAASDPGGASSLFTAVQALGLKLESRKAPTEQLVVDKAEKMPTEN